MQKYIGTKQVLAKPMNRQEYNEYRDWDLPANEDGKEEGYLVEYVDSPNANHPKHKNYISWSPKDVFEKAYRLINNLTFGQAIEALKQGKRVARKGWNGKGMFVFRQIPADIPSHIVPNMQSLPQSVKDEFQRRFDEIKTSPEMHPKSATEIHYLNQYALVKPNNEINGWNPSVADCEAEDWVILD